MSSSQGFPLSAEQRRVWAVQGPASVLRVQCALIVEGALDPPRLRSAAEELVAAHEILRTTYRRPPGHKAPLQVIAEGLGVAWRVEDASGGDDAPARAAQSAARVLREEAEASFDLEAGPILRMAVARIAPDRHVVSLTLPALAADRRTLRLLARELWPEGPVPSVESRNGAIEYADYCEWQNELLRSEEGEARAARSFWGKRAAMPGVLPFSSAPRQEPGAFAWESSPTSALSAEGVESACRALGASPAEFLLACWQTLLWRLTGEPAIAVRVMHEGRKFAELDRAIGRFARALPAGEGFDNLQTFADAVRSTAAGLREADEWAEYLDPDQDADRATGGVGTAGFELAEDLPPWRSGSTRVSLLEEDGFLEALPVTLSCLALPGELRARWHHDPRAYERSDVERLGEQFRTLVRAASENSDTAPSAIPILPPAERDLVVVAWNQTRADFPSRGVHELFEDRARETPEAPAVVARDERLSYGELDARANRLARYLRERGVGPDMRVGLAVDRSVEMVVAILAVVKAGGAYVPLDPDHPSGRLEHQLAESGARLLLISGTAVSPLSGFAGETLRLDRDRELFAGGDPGRLEPLAGPDDLIYVLYTSGSTGAPKGVAVRHSSLANYTQFMTERLLGATRAATPLVFATVSTITADLGNTAIFPALASGGCVRVIDMETAMDGERFAAELAREPVDVLKIVPSHLAALLPAGAGVLPRKFLILGGEALRWDLVRRVEALGAGCRILNHYGPTETTVGSMTRMIESGETPGPSRTVPIGRPIANTEVFLLDDAGAPVPVGVAGEIHIGGAGLARGYVNQPEETSRRFVRHPFSAAPGARVYRTGDRGRYLPNGDVEYLGRVDDQVKIRGFRIEPAEVSAAVAAHPTVRECFVAGREDSSGDLRLIAYVVPVRGAPASAEELRAFVKGRLPDYMVPSAFVSLKQFPLTANGKVDRRALPLPEKAVSRHRYVEPRTPMERTVAGVWAEVLRVERVGAEDNFFDLGGHSLLLTQVVARLRKILDTDLPIRWLFEAATVAELAERVDAAEREDVARILDELEALPDHDNAERTGSPR